MISRKEARSIIRKALKRVPEGEEIRHLNIMPMMDIMTILLVAFLFTVNEDATLAIGTVEMPGSRSFLDKTEQAVALTIAPSGILVEGEAVVEIKNGRVDGSEVKDGPLGSSIPKLSQWLGLTRKTFEADLAAKGKEIPKQPEIFIIADRRTPYRTLFQVINSSRDKDAGYRRFRLIVLQGVKEDKDGAAGTTAAQ